MSVDRILAFRRTIRTYMGLGVTREQVREGVVALKDDVCTIADLESALQSYLPASAFDDDRSFRELAAEPSHNEMRPGRPTHAQAA